VKVTKKLLIGEPRATGWLKLQNKSSELVSCKLRFSKAESARIWNRRFFRIAIWARSILGGFFSKIVEKRTLHSAQMELQITELPNFAPAPTLSAIQSGARTDAANRLQRMRKISAIFRRQVKISD